jgi:hypothetical protein
MLSITPKVFANVTTYWSFKCKTISIVYLFSPPNSAKCGVMCTFNKLFLSLNCANMKHLTVRIATRIAWKNSLNHKNPSNGETQKHKALSLVNAVKQTVWILSAYAKNLQKTVNKMTHF